MIEYGVQAAGMLAGKLAELLKKRLEKNKRQAKVKATGEIIDVVPYLNPNGEHLSEVLFNESGIDCYRTFSPEELEFVNEPTKKEIDWEERRFLVSAAMLPVISQTVIRVENGTIFKHSKQECVAMAVEYADALIEKLQK